MATHDSDDIAVLREMVRLAENRRTEELQMLERVNSYNLALIAFSGSFLSLLVTQEFSTSTVFVAGLLLIASVVLSMLTIRPRTFKGNVVIHEDITKIRQKEPIDLPSYLLETAAVTTFVADNIAMRIEEKKSTTKFAAIFLVLALFTVYISYVMPGAGNLTDGI